MSAPASSPRARPGARYRRRAVLQSFFPVSTFIRGSPGEPKKVSQIICNPFARAASAGFANVRRCRGVSGLVIFDLAAGWSTDYRDEVGRSLGAELARDRGRSRLVEEPRAEADQRRALYGGRQAGRRAGGAPETSA